MFPTPATEPPTEQSMFESIRTWARKWAPWEERLLAALHEKFGRNHREILQRQIDAVNKIQRIVGWTEIDLYVMRHGRMCWDDIPKFLEDRDFTLARASTFFGEKRIQSDLSCVRRLFFSIESEAPIKALAFREDITIEIVDYEKRFTPLFKAVFNSRGNGDLIRLLRARGASPYATNKHGVSPLKLARTITNFDVRKFFVDLPEETNG
jgi:hypothetical protein